MSDAYGYKELGQFLKAKRNQISPTQVGLPYGGKRRAPGLKREEVAQLASVSLTWYTWLEQNRSIKVSEQVLESIGHALLLNETEMKYIFSLAQLAIPELKPSSAEFVSKPIQTALNKFDPYPAFASDQYWNVIAWNASANAIFGNFDKMSSRERNTVWRMFKTPHYKELFTEWHKAAEWIVAQFRISCGKYNADSWFSNFVNELMEDSIEFKTLWLNQNVCFDTNFKKSISYKTLGTLLFDFTSYDLSANSQIKIALHTPADEDTSHKLNKLL